MTAVVVALPGRVTPPATIHGLYARYVTLYGEMETPSFRNGAAAFNELCDIEIEIAALPASNQAERALKSVIATLADRDTANGQAIVASLERDLLAA